MHKISLLSHNWLALLINNRQVARHLSAMSGVVYDLGCGKRPYEQDILRHAQRYVGVDWTNSLHGRQTDVTANLNEPLPIEDAAADTVVSFQVLEHLSRPDIMLVEARRILKPGGKLLLAVPFQWAVHEAPWDFYRYTQYGLIHQLTQAGFSDIQVEAVSGFLPPWVLKLNYQTLRLARGPKPLQWLIKLLLLPLWLGNQTAALLLDPLWRGEEETMGYFVTARKP